LGTDPSGAACFLRTSLYEAIAGVLPALKLVRRLKTKFRPVWTKNDSSLLLAHTGR